MPERVQPWIGISRLIAPGERPEREGLGTSGRRFRSIDTELPIDILTETAARNMLARPHATNRLL
jgi:hypothetical protein